MRRLILVRHASHDRLGRILCGRMPGVSLSGQGRAEAGAVARRLGGTGATRILSSPRERAQETAVPIAEALGLQVETADGLDEIDFGAWTGRSFSELAGEPAWVAWNEARSTARPPGGESMAEAQRRIWDLVEGFAEADEVIAILVSHGDVIRAAILRLLGLSLDAYDGLVVDPASCSEVALWPGGGRLVSLNERVAP
ncbi:histidine phosphatase family protein [Methylobacterium segetis]|uniref:histidine phosphatase family protein n=1 Tax=Methylobacterium segetis TaxID=2488750 RepID=UPI00104B6F1D|nr:histidine phosphatase family protein [Methylobacterium segetis]